MQTNGTEWEKKLLVFINIVVLNIAKFEQNVDCRWDKFVKINYCP